MATPSDSEIAKLLNLNSADSDAFLEVVNAYFGPRDTQDDDLFSDDDESDQGKKKKQCFVYFVLTSTFPLIRSVCHLSTRSRSRSSLLYLYHSSLLSCPTFLTVP